MRFRMAEQSDTKMKHRHFTDEKVTGVLLFIFPLTLSIIPLKYSGVLICSAAIFAAVQEGQIYKTIIILYDNQI